MHHADDLLGGARGLQLGQQARQHGLRGRGADDDQQLVADQPDQAEDREAARSARPAPSTTKTKNAQVPQKTTISAPRFVSDVAAEHGDRVGHAAERAERRRPHDQPDHAEDDLRGDLEDADDRACAGARRASRSPPRRGSRARARAGSRSPRTAATKLVGSRSSVMKPTRPGAVSPASAIDSLAASRAGRARLAVEARARARRRCAAIRPSASAIDRHREEVARARAARARRRARGCRATRCRSRP